MLSIVTSKFTKSVNW